VKHEKIDNKARVWVVVRAADGTLQEEIDAQLVASLQAGQTSEEIADTLVIAAGAAEIAETRLW